MSFRLYPVCQPYVGQISEDRAKAVMSFLSSSLYDYSILPASSFKESPHGYGWVIADICIVHNVPFAQHEQFTAKVEQVLTQIGIRMVEALVTQEATRLVEGIATGAPMGGLLGSQTTDKSEGKISEAFIASLLGSLVGGVIGGLIGNSIKREEIVGVMRKVQGSWKLLTSPDDIAPYQTQPSQ